MKRKCDGCQHWTKHKGTGSLKGLCNLKDWSCPSDNGCDDFKHKPFKRNSQKVRSQLQQDIDEHFMEMEDPIDEEMIRILDLPVEE